MMEKIISLNFITKAVPFLSAWKNEIKTDIPVGNLAKLAGVFGDVGKYRITSIPLSTDNILKDAKSANGQYILTPDGGEFDWNQIRDYLNIQLEASASADRQ